MKVVESAPVEANGELVVGVGDGFLVVERVRHLQDLNGAPGDARAAQNAADAGQRAWVKVFFCSTVEGVPVRSSTQGLAPSWTRTEHLQASQTSAEPSEEQMIALMSSTRAPRTLIPRWNC